MPAAQAQTVAPPLAKPASFTDPAGRERVFADQASADAASAKIQSPEGMADLKRSILNRKFDLTSTGQIPEGTFNAQELALAAPALPPPNLPLLKGEETSSSPPLQGGGLTSSSPPLEGGVGGGPVDVIRGTQVSRTGTGGGTGGGGGSPTDIYRDALAGNLQAGLEHGADIRQYAPEIKFLSEAEENSAAALKASQGRLPTLSQFQAQRAQELIRDPGAINPADELVFPNRGAPAAPKINTRKLFENANDPGFQTGQLDYALDADGKYREVEVERAGAGSTGVQERVAGQAPPAAVAKLKKNPQFAAAFKQKYGYLPAGL